MARSKVVAYQQFFSRKWIVKINDETLHSAAGGCRYYKTPDSALAAGIKEAAKKGLSVGGVESVPCEKGA